VELRPKSFEVLRYLVEHAGHVAAKEEVMAAIWSNVTVTDDSLIRCIGEVRRAIGDESQRIVKTVPRRGYLFDAPVLPHHDFAESRARERRLSHCKVNSKPIRSLYPVAPQLSCCRLRTSRA
jgi:adenylate cyclase